MTQHAEEPPFGMLHARQPYASDESRLDLLQAGDGVTWHVERRRKRLHFATQRGDGRVAVKALVEVLEQLAVLGLNLQTQARQRRVRHIARSLPFAAQALTQIILTSRQICTARMRNSPTFWKSASLRPREVMAGAPTRTPPGESAEESPKTAFLFNVMCARSHTFSSLLPVSPRGRRSHSACQATSGPCQRRGWR
eukprot:scaffold659_cov329-Prasinococcus_capsulatus_cf.AAC.2